jgi:hypothetical protein
MRKANRDVRTAFLSRAALDRPSVKEVVNAIKAIPHGRPRERSTAGVVEDWRGTCSTKLLLLREVCPDLSMRFLNRVFRMTPDAAKRYLGPEAAEVIPPEGMVDVHTFARVLVEDRWVTIDVTFPGDVWDGSSEMSIPWGEGEDFDAGDDPIAHKEALLHEVGDPALRARFIAVISA